MHVVCDDLGEWVAGLRHAGRAAELQPASAQLRYNLALSMLRLGEYREGFAQMEARLDKPDWTGLAIAPARVADWRRRYEASGRPGALKIGLVFHANPASASAALRSVPPADLAPLLTSRNIDWVNLQGGPAGRALAAAHQGIIDATAKEVPLDEFAAAIAATDLLVTVDTMGAHCAGALGHPFRLLVPFSPHWCWGLARNRTLWYPTARLFRQSGRCEWTGPIRAVAETLSAPSVRGSEISARRRVVNL